jgi:release factor glutamine methyltransferase
MATVRALLQEASKLATDDPRREAEILLCHCLDKDRAWLYTWPEAEISSPEGQRYADMIAARSCGAPIAYLTGRREFWSLQLEVNEHTLIPRAETETLIEWALELELSEQAFVLDMGTGSGAIALALANEREAWNLTAVDASEAALDVARRNGERLGLSRVSFQTSDWYAALNDKRYHLIVSNPPYIEEGDVHLSRGDLTFEPQIALVAADRGMADLALIIDGAAAHLHPGGVLLLEHGYDQAVDVRSALQSSGFASVQTRRDMAGQERVTGGVLAC